MRLIDADLLRWHLFVTESRTGGSREIQAYERGWDDALKAVMVYEPTVVDAVEVVRCNDCKHFHGDGLECRWGMYAYEDDYCSNGERRKADEH